MGRWLVWTLVAVAIGAAVLWATVLRGDAVPVKVVAVERGRVESTVTNTKAGTVRARRRAQLSPEVGGSVLSIDRREGDRVKRGETLLRLDPATQEARFSLARGSLRAAEAAKSEACIERDRAGRELQRKRELAKEKIFSEDLLDRLESAYAMGKAACRRGSAEVERAGAEVRTSEVALEKMVIRAPFAGVIAEIAVEVGEWITPSPPLLRAPAVIDIIDPTSVYVSAPMDEVDSVAVLAGQRAKLTVDSQPDVEFSGNVVRVAPYVLDVEAQNRTVEIEVEFDGSQPAPTVLPGTSADVEVVLETRDAVPRVPTASLLEGSRVLVAQNGRLVEREVEIGLRNWDWTEVRSGLEEGERVVISLDRIEVEAGARVEAELVEHQP